MSTGLYTSLISFIEEENIEYGEKKHKKVFTSEQANELSNMKLGEGIKTLAIQSKDRIAIVTLRDDERLNFSVIKKIIGKRARFMKEEDIIRVLKTEIGGLCPFGYEILESDNPLLLISENAYSLSSIEINPGRNDRTIFLNEKQFKHLLIKSNSFIMYTDGRIESISNLVKVK